MYIDDLFSLNRKVSVVIGGRGVLGGAICEGFAHAGADIVILGRNKEKAEVKAEKIRKIGRKCLTVKMDASNKKDIEKAHTQILKKFGKIDVLVNAPGINSSTPFFDIKEPDWHEILDVNLKSVYLSCQVFSESMIRQKRGSIINISSASSAVPLSKVFTYSISKAGIENLTKFLAREFAVHNVRVNTIAPGFFPAEQNRKILTKERIKAIFNHTPMKRFGEPEELIGAAIWLASEKVSSFVTGATIRIDGGFTAMTI